VKNNYESSEAYFLLTLNAFLVKANNSKTKLWTFQLFFNKKKTRIPSIDHWVIFVLSFICYYPVISTTENTYTQSFNHGLKYDSMVYGRYSCLFFIKENWSSSSSSIGDHRDLIWLMLPCFRLLVCFLQKTFRSFGYSNLLTVFLAVNHVITSGSILSG
jgi:hypothetical protein